METFPIAESSSEDLPHLEQYNIAKRFFNEGLSASRRINTESQKQVSNQKFNNISCRLYLFRKDSRDPLIECNFATALIFAQSFQQESIPPSKPSKEKRIISKSILLLFL